MFASKAKMEKIDRLKKRSDFLRVQRSGRKWVSRGLILQVDRNDCGTPRFGLTVTKKVSTSAVERNRIKRRLRAAAYDILPDHAKQATDYILVGRRETADRTYHELLKDLKWCMKRLDSLAEVSTADNAENNEGAAS